MICQGCHQIGVGTLCPDCAADLRPAPDRILPGGIRAVAAFVHGGVAAHLVHDLKYRGIPLVADLAVDAIREHVGHGLTFCPIPRVWTRFLRFGIDPAMEMANRLAESTSGDVVTALIRPLHSPRRAGSDVRGRPPTFRARASSGPVALVDDVLTTGSTVSAAVRALGQGRTKMVVTITSRPKTPTENWENQVSSP